jgi:RecA/RadA recombinase
MSPVTKTKKKTPARKPAQKKTSVKNNGGGVTPDAREQFLDMLVNKLEVQTMDEEELTGPQARIPFLSPMLTWATTGGVKIGQVCRWYGTEGSGKSLTNLGLLYMAQRFPEVLFNQYERKMKVLEQRQGMKMVRMKAKRDYAIMSARHPEPLSALIIDAEGRFEPELARQLGVKVSKDTCYPVFENIIEVVCDIAKGAFKDKAYDIVILDSAAACESIEKAGLESGAYERGADPRAWARIKGVTRAARRVNGTFIIVDQVRTQGIGGGGLGSGAMHRGPSLGPPNVRVIKHQASLAVEFNEGKKLYLDSNRQLTDEYEKASNDFPHLGAKGNEPHGLEMRCKVVKNSTGRPYRSARMRFHFEAADRHGEVVQGTGFDEPFELFETALEFGMLDNPGNGAHYYRLDEDGNRFPKNQTKGKAMHGLAKVRAAILDDEEWAESIRQRLVAMT